MKSQSKLITVAVLLILYGALVGVGFFTPIIRGTIGVSVIVGILFLTAVGVALTQPWGRVLALIESLLMIVNSYVVYIDYGKRVLSRPEFYITFIFGAVILYFLLDEKVRTYFSDIKISEDKDWSTRKQ